MKTVHRLSTLTSTALFLLATNSTPTRARLSHHKPVPPSFATSRNSSQPRAQNGTSTSDITPKASDRVNNGHHTSPGQYPFFSQMWWNGNPQGCGGSLIASKWVLTAAHCVKQFVENIPATGFPEWRVGSYCIQSDNCGAPVQTIQSKQGIIHPWYNAETPKWDFALLELAETAFATPVHIDDDSSMHNALQWGSTVRGIGMGYVNDQGEFSSHLLEVDNHFLPLDTCRLYFSTGDDFDDSVMCTNGANFGLCDGDSGSPVLVRAPGKSPYDYSQISVTSFGAPICENHNYPDGSARIGAAMDWIKDSICPSYAPWEGNRPSFCPEVAPLPQPTLEPTPMPQPDPTPAPQSNPTRAPQSNPTAAPQSNPTPYPSTTKTEDAESDNEIRGDSDCNDEDLFFHFKKRKYRSCKKVKGQKKVAKLCNRKKTDAIQLCRKACGTCP